MKPLKVKISITIDPSVLKEIKILAEKDERLVSQYINIVLLEHIIKSKKYFTRNKTGGLFIMDAIYIEVILGYALMRAEMLDYGEKERINLIGELEVALQLFSDHDAKIYFNDYRKYYYDNLTVVIDGMVIPNEYNEVRLADMDFETPKMKVKVCNALGRYGFKCIRDLHHITKEDFLNMNHFGEKSYYELTAAVRKMIGET